MNQTSFSVRRGLAVQQHSNPVVASFFAVMVCLGSTAGCGVEQGVEQGVEPEAVGTWDSEVATAEEMTTMGLSTNGLSTNGLSTNGLSTNGLSTNGLSTNGLLTGTFKSWFEGDPSLHAMAMKYIVMCALPQGQSRTYTSSTGQVYTWYGLLGLAPGWASGSLPTVAEQQIITACLAAHTNKFGLNIKVSVLGRSAAGVEIPYTSSEMASYSENEACFFGNTFTNEGIFAANDRTFLKPSESTTRACGLSSKQNSTDCSPMVHIDSCRTYCTLDATKTYYVSCTYNGVTYKPITTRIRPVDIYQCGDGVCQFTEKCGTSTQYDSCYADCGACPP
jgi:hypothetical protein